MAESRLRARALATLVVAAALLYAQCGGNKTTTPSPITPNPTPIDPNPNPPITSGPQVFIGAGDIGWNPSDNGQTGGQAATAALIAANVAGGSVFTAGDNAYLDGSARNFTDWYDPSWGRFKTFTRPVPGNHEYDNHADMSGYFGYFGANAIVGGPGGGYYSFELGDWHAVMLNSSDHGAAQLAWLRADLMAHASAKCTIAVFHFPLFSSGLNGPIASVRPIWDILYQFNVDVVVSGHDHLYERFAPQDPTGFPDPAKGIREFVVGTGGAKFYGFTRGTTPNSERQIANTYGVLKLTLGPGYEWQFIPVAGQGDSGKGVCH